MKFVIPSQIDAIPFMTPKHQLIGITSVPLSLQRLVTSSLFPPSVSSVGPACSPPPTVRPAQARSLSSWHYAAAEQAPQTRPGNRPIGRGNAARGWVEKDGGRKRAAWWISASRLRRRSLAPRLLRGSTRGMLYCFCFPPAVDSAAPRLDLWFFFCPMP